MRDSAARPSSPGRRAALAAMLAWPAVHAARPEPALARHLPGLLAGCGLPKASLGLCVAGVDTDRVVAELNGDRPFVMASTAKVVTSLAALDMLGPHWRWRTFAFATGPIIRGRLLGDLLIVGGGDPSLSTAELRQWLQRLRAQGLDDIRGDLVVDRSAFHFDERDHDGTPPPDPDRPHHARPDALLIDAGTVQVRLQARGGGTAEVLSEPPLSAPLLVNRLGPGRGCRAALRWHEQQGHAQLSVEGRWGPRCGAGQLHTALPAGTSLAAQAVGALWRDVGGRLAGRLRERDLSAGDPERLRLPLLGADGAPLLPLSTHESPPLPEVMHELNKNSNNLAARHLMLSLAGGFPARPATLDRARERLQQWLRRQGLAAGDIELDNGSGLSRAERSRPQALVQLLRRAWARPGARVFVDSLPVAGIDGTLAHRLRDSAATGQAFLKTGTLRDTRAVAGYVRSGSGRVHAVAVFVNHPAAASATPAIDRVIDALARSG